MIRIEQLTGDGPKGVLIYEDDFTELHPDLPNLYARREELLFKGYNVTMSPDAAEALEAEMREVEHDICRATALVIPDPGLNDDPHDLARELLRIAHAIVKSQEVAHDVVRELRRIAHAIIEAHNEKKETS